MWTHVTWSAQHTHLDVCFPGELSCVRISDRGALSLLHYRAQAFFDSSDFGDSMETRTRCDALRNHRQLRRNSDPVHISDGEDILQQFFADTGFNECVSVSLFDHHNVVDLMSWDTAATVGIALSHLRSHRSYLLSYGKAHRRTVFHRDNEYNPMIEELDGYIFTDTFYNRSSTVTVYQDDWMRDDYDDNGHNQCTIIGVTGDKGQVARILNKPAILFDDREDNVDQVLQARHGNAGFVVRIGHKYYDHVRTLAPFPASVTRRPGQWEALSRQFRDQVLHSCQRAAIPAVSL
jgi:hypothetical protein